MTREPHVVVNGHDLTPAQAMTMRVALESFARSLARDGLGDDTHGREMVRLYTERISEIRAVMHQHTRIP